MTISRQLHGFLKGLPCRRRGTMSGPSSARPPTAKHYYDVYKCERARSKERARALDARHHAGVRDPDARPILQRLLQYPAVRGDCVGAFGECSRDLHSLLHDTVRSAAERHWREAGATSARAAESVYTAIYRRRWGCETALQGARLRLSRAYLAAGGDARRAPRGDVRGASC